MVTSDLLHLAAQVIDLFSVLLIARGDEQRHDITHRVDSSVDFAALTTLSTVISSTSATLGRALQSAAIHDGNGRNALLEGVLANQ
ncbi:hypothetical protein A2G07_15860 (plasmid) [Deinococcus radiodurans R1 = ATCC 13939 = DSM 20539]|nr:hypothetical protein A2G07_07045 [Deinococcus radiodurans R1 = ATCC 13939 = DSM 20539]ANC73326.1 hypothetical protein A2G07_15860 [Deinococcus radiodurans R1 = ATCC 13939 = DSM 20539]